MICNASFRMSIFRQLYTDPYKLIRMNYKEVTSLALEMFLHFIISIYRFENLSIMLIHTRR